ncbi:hypothetical protein GOP47_0029130 [Adiantum capillus-veneris]|nr:hypothetical protein GOP47_0029130 [Adiantum capillus-veneris]
MASGAPADPSPYEPGNSSSTKNAWSQVLRSKDAAASTKKPLQLANSEQIPSIAKEPLTNQVRGQMQANAELGLTLSESALDADNVASVPDARVFDEASVKGEELVEISKTVDGNAVTADCSEASQNKLPESSHGDVADARVSRPPWRKPPVSTEGDVKPQPVMGATTWPALTEARNMKKSSETKKLKAFSAKTPHPEGVASIQESYSKVPLHSGDGANNQQGVKNKPSSRGGPVGIGRPAFQPIENGASFLEHPAMGAHGGPEQSSKPSPHARIKGSMSANPIMDKDRIHHNRNDGAGSFYNNNSNNNNNGRKWRNNHRDQSRGWHNHGRAYENSGDMVTLLHEQRIGPRNMPRAQPFMNMNPGFYPPMPHFQNGGMYYIPPGASEFVHGPPYFPPVAPPGGVGVIGLDPFSLQSMLLKQVDYYFSVENLCRDVFLRTHMDEEGFVPVSVIAQFNRIRSLSSNPMVILDALQYSAVVEVQNDRIRRRNDRGKWRLLRDQVYNVNRTQENLSVGNFSEREVERAHVSSQEANIGSAVERAGDGGLVSLSEGANNVSSKASDTPLTVDGIDQSSSDRSNGSGECADLEEKSVHDDVKSTKAQDINMLGPDESTQSFFPRDDNREESAVCSDSANNSAGYQSCDATTLQDGPESTDTNRVTICQETSFNERDTAFQAAADGKPVCWKGPEGFWTEHSAYLRHGAFEQAAMKPRESDFVLKMHEGGEEHHAEANDRELDRLISVPRTSLGSFIAVP